MSAWKTNDWGGIWLRTIKPCIKQKKQIEDDYLLSFLIQEWMCIKCNYEVLSQKEVGGVFTQHAVKLWSSLPQDVVHAPQTVSLKEITQIDRKYLPRTIKWKDIIFYGASEQMTSELAITFSWEILEKYGYNMVLYFFPSIFAYDCWT